MRVKVCGLKTVADAAACVSAGVDWVGFNFHPKSVRYVDPHIARDINNALDGKVEGVGLFVNRDPADVLQIADEAGLGIVQLHGAETPESLCALERLRVIKAFRVGDQASIDAMLAYLDRCESLGCAPYAVLVDAYVPGVEGGTGVAIGDDLLRALPGHERLILAGGLTPTNVADRLQKSSPWMVDVASGVESEPGRKSASMIEAFVAAARSR